MTANVFTFAVRKLSSASEQHLNALNSSAPNTAVNCHASSLFWTKCCLRSAQANAGKRSGTITYRRCEMSLKSRLQTVADATP
eukprot:2408282-Pleurochrysis_carterae.AAC.1